MRFSTIAAIVALIVYSELRADADNWPQWRGPEGNGVAASGNYPTDFSNTANVAWSVELPGLGCSTPAVWDDSIFVTCDINGQDGVVCYSRHGETRWQKELGPNRGPRNRVASGSNPSPATDGEHVIVYFKSGTVVCLDFAGNVLWKHNLQQEYVSDTLQWDLGTSPVIVDGKAVIAVMHRKESFLIAYDIESGDVAWRALRDYNVNAESNDSYSTPNIASVDGHQQIIVWGADHLSGHDAATGEKQWEYSGFNPGNAGNWRVIASSASDDGVAVVPYGRGGLVAAVRLGESGDVRQESDVLWRKEGRRLGPDVATPVIDGDRVYLLSDAPAVACYDLQSGEQLWSLDLPRSRQTFYASPVLAGDLLYCTRQDGTIFVAKVSDENAELVAENQMNEQVLATPIPLDNGLLVRGEQHLWRIGN